MGIDEMIDRYKEIQARIKSLDAEKRDLESQILSLLPYNKDGQRTVETLNHKVCIKAGYYYKVVGEVEYIGDKDLPIELNPFKQKVSWELDKKKYEMLRAYPKYLEFVDDFIEKLPKPVKLEV